MRMKIGLSFRLRQLLGKPEALNLLKKISEVRYSERKIIFLASTHTEFYRNIEYYAQNQWMPKNHFDNSVNVFDGPFLDELKDMKVIRDYSIDTFENSDVPPDEDGEFWGVEIFNLNLKRLDILLEWIGQLSQIVHFGYFSLNLVTGTGFYKDNFCNLNKNSVPFKLLKALLTTPSHELSISAIELLIDGKPRQESTNPHDSHTLEVVEKERFTRINEIVKKLGKSLGIGKNLTRIISYNGTGFVIIQ